MSNVQNALSGLTSLSSSIQSYVISPLQAFGLGGLMLDIEGEDRVELANDITDHYVENNSAVQDHIAIKPKKITIRGYVGEVIYKGQPGSGNTPLNTVAQKLTTYAAALPALTAGASQAASLYSQSQAGDISTQQLVTAGAGTAANLYGLVKNLISAASNKQQAAYQYLKALRDQKTLFAVQTPFEFMTNMAIEMLIMIQPEETIYMSQIQITLKEVRTAATASIKTQGGQTTNNITPQAAGDGQGNNALQSAASVVQGSTAGADPAIATVGPSNVPPLLPAVPNVVGSSNYTFPGIPIGVTP